MTNKEIAKERVMDKISELIDKEMNFDFSIWDNSFDVEYGCVENPKVECFKWKGDCEDDRI